MKNFEPHPYEKCEAIGCTIPRGEHCLCGRAPGDPIHIDAPSVPTEAAAA